MVWEDCPVLLTQACLQLKPLELLTWQSQFETLELRLTNIRRDNGDPNLE